MIARVEGSYSNVIGLPMEALERELQLALRWAPEEGDHALRRRWELEDGKGITCEQRLEMIHGPDHRWKRATE